MNKSTTTTIAIILLSMTSLVLSFLLLLVRFSPVEYSNISHADDSF